VWPGFNFAMEFKFELTMAHVRYFMVGCHSLSKHLCLSDAWGLCSTVRYHEVSTQKHRRAKFCYGWLEEPKNQPREPMTADHNDCPSEGVHHSTWPTGEIATHTCTINHIVPLLTTPNHCQQRTEHLLGPAPSVVNVEMRRGQPKNWCGT